MTCRYIVALIYPPFLNVWSLSHFFSTCIFELSLLSFHNPFFSFSFCSLFKLVALVQKNSNPAQHLNTGKIFLRYQFFFAFFGRLHRNFRNPQIQMLHQSVRLPDKTDLENWVHTPMSNWIRCPFDIRFHHNDHTNFIVFELHAISQGCFERRLKSLHTNNDAFFWFSLRPTFQKNSECLLFKIVRFLIFVAQASGLSSLMNPPIEEAVGWCPEKINVIRILIFINYSKYFGNNAWDLEFWCHYCQNTPGGSAIFFEAFCIHLVFWIFLLYIFVNF